MLSNRPVLALGHKPISRICLRQVEMTGTIVGEKVNNLSTVVVGGVLGAGSGRSDGWKDLIYAVGEMKAAYGATG